MFKDWEKLYAKWHKCLHPDHPLNHYKTAPNFKDPIFIPKVIDILQQLDYHWTAHMIHKTDYKQEESTSWMRQPFTYDITKKANIRSLTYWCEQAILLLAVSMASFEITIKDRHKISLWAANTVAPFLQEKHIDNTKEKAISELTKDGIKRRHIYHKEIKKIQLLE